MPSSNVLTSEASRVPGSSPRAAAPGLLGLIGAISLATLGAAWAYEMGGLAPCELCLLGRWPHYLLGVLGFAGGLFLSRKPAYATGRVLLGLAFLIAAVGVGIAVFHTGVEQKWWTGPTACTAQQSATPLSVDEMLAKIEAAPVVMCDEPQWHVLGLSMASWNGLILLLQAGMAGLGTLLLLRRRRTRA